MFLGKPIKPALPAINAEQLMCLDDETYGDLVERELLRKNYGEELEAIIDANNAGVSDGR